ncbi:exonuclease 3'-5' domain-containing protein 2-like [Anastrepha obliqua]|uniref:exonuclease 3'-5' domain-containing protein 2-like n=1 Tax=Anastrepha obliqua TaxID=95512 RepID=UPI00240A943B|nr:exonuclease 3'-5' domain-containing protein 2-like [Anastrepha obliqua]
MENPKPLQAVAIGAGAGLLYWWFRSGSNEQTTVVINNYKECEDAVNILREHCDDYHVVKVGVAPLDDAGRLSREFNLTTVSTLDLRFVAVLTGKKPGTLAAMYERVVGGTLKCLDLSANWQANNLTQEQIDYAAGHANAGIQIYTTLAQKVSDVSVFKQYYGQRYDPHHMYVCLI